MKVAINITREALGGITTTNLSLLTHLHGSDVSFAGIELNPFRSFKAASIFRHLSPEWFSHHIVGICDYGLSDLLKKSKSLSDLEKHFKPIIEKVREILRKERPDIMLINGTYYVPWILSIACRKERIPVVLWYAGVLTKETSYFPKKDRKIMRDMERSVVRRASKIIFPSEICRQTVLEVVIDRNNVRDAVVIPNPISPVFTHADKLDFTVERRITFVGRFSRIKRPKKFIRIHELLKKAGWDHEAIMVTDFHTPKLRKKVPKSINVIPSMDPKALRTFYATQGLVICPSEFETFGNVPVEAACVGVPVLVNETMGCAQVFREANLSKFVIDFNDTKAVLQRVRELCGQAILAKQMNNLRKRVDVKYIAQEIVSILEKTRKERNV
ncbi:MAG: glycosyltransferase family 4 protein [bacterium]|nr:glycosyltransferase family 4 protein [bacterium]